jgi:hypothetical protein
MLLQLKAFLGLMLMGKTMCKKLLSVELMREYLPPLFISPHQRVTLSNDIMFVNKIATLVYY